MAPLNLKLIAAACENMGIGKNNNLPWKLKNEMAYFSKMTTTTRSPDNVNAIVMGRRTWESIPAKIRPLPGRLNVILTSNPDALVLPDDALAFRSLSEALVALQDRKPNIESVWVVGGYTPYKEAMEHPWCTRVYLTRIEKTFDCDTFFPDLPSDFQLLTEYGEDSDLVPKELQTENGINYKYNIYEKKTINST